MEASGLAGWLLAEGNIPSQSHGPSPQMTIHESCAC